MRDEQRDSEEVLKQILDFCEFAYLLSFPRRARLRWPKEPIGTNFCHLWRMQAAKTLGWCARCKEGVLEAFLML